MPSFSKPFLALTGALALSGCVNLPMSVDEFRVSDSSFVEHESFVVARPYREVAETVARKAQECFAGAQVDHIRPGLFGDAVVQQDFYNPSFTADAGKATMILQKRQVGGSEAKFYDQPEKGFYVLAVDLTDRGGETAVDMHAFSLGYDHIGREVKAWTRNESDLCPDLAEVDL